MEKAINVNTLITTLDPWSEVNQDDNILTHKNLGRNNCMKHAWRSLQGSLQETPLKATLMGMKMTLDEPSVEWRSLLHNSEEDPFKLTGSNTVDCDLKKWLADFWQGFDEKCSDKLTLFDWLKVCWDCFALWSRLLFNAKVKSYPQTETKARLFFIYWWMDNENETQSRLMYVY